MAPSLIICLVVVGLLLPSNAFRTMDSRRAPTLLFSAAHTSSEPCSPTTALRNDVASRTALLSLLSLPLLARAPAAQAKVYFDTDVYGDKELKIATTNKIKQKLRNAILADFSLAPLFYELAINDALGFDAATLSGGPDGSIGLFEMDREMNKDLSRAVDTIKVIMAELKRTNTVGFGDLVSYAGAEALETAGCGRIVVQVGRFDATSENPKTSGVNWSIPGSADDVTGAFYSSGLDAKDTALLLGALGEVKRITKDAFDAASKKKKGGDDDDEEEEEGGDDSWQSNVPSTFGKRSEIYGKQMGKHDFGIAYFSRLLKAEKQGAQADIDAIGRALLSDPKVKTFVQKYAGQGGETAFLADVPVAYNKLTTLGLAYTTRNS